MIVLIHVLVALATLGSSGLAVLRPSRGLIAAAYSLLAATLISGTYLVVASHARILQTCLTGLAFVAVSSACLFAAQRRLATDA